LNRLVGFLCVLACAGKARAMRIDVAPAEVCRMSSLAVVGEVTTRTTVWTQDGSLETVVDVAVSAVLKGAPRSDLVVVTPGGELGELRQIVEESARLTLDTRYLLLLHEQPDGRFVVTGGEGGAFAMPAGSTEAWARSLVGSCLAR
jgi:hypothetical protein